MEMKMLGVFGNDEGEVEEAIGRTRLIWMQWRTCWISFEDRRLVLEEMRLKQGT
jgi:hypothetical protein